MSKNKHATGVLSKAILEGDVAAAKEAIANGADVNHKWHKLDGGYSLMHRAARSAKSNAILKLLIDAKANVHALDANAWTPLHMAAAWHNGEAITMLRAAGADVNAKSKDGKTPLDALWESHPLGTLPDGSYGVVDKGAIAALLA